MRWDGTPPPNNEEAKGPRRPDLQTDRQTDMEILWDFFLSITFPTTSLTSVSTSYVDSCKALLSPTDDYLVTVVNYYSVYPSSFG